MLVSTHVPAAFHEAARRLSDAEKLRDEPVDTVRIAYDEEAGLATINVSVPTDITNSGATLSIVAQDYAPIPGFNATAVTELTNGASIDAPSKAVLVMGQYMAGAIQDLIDANQPVTENLSVSISTNFADGITSISATMPIQFVLNANGQTEIVVPNYFA
ncbi:MAG: hypothetical protein Fur0042_12550 [Cyanophyceae cyanobacterium]